MNKTDKEIIMILKEVFQLKRVYPLRSDDRFRLWCIRSFFLSSVLLIIFRIIYGFNNEISSELSTIINIPIAIFFTLLFLHINNKSENHSLIIMVLTWISLLINLFI